METLEKIKWLPIWLIMFSLLFLSGAYFYKQSLLTHIGDAFLNDAITKGMFTNEKVNELLDKLDRVGFERDKIRIEISPAKALNVGVDKDSGEDIELVIDPDKKAMISYIFDVLTPGHSNIRYYYKRAARSEEYFD